MSIDNEGDITIPRLWGMVFRRADQLRLGDRVVWPPYINSNGTVVFDARSVVVHMLQIIGDDVEINGTTTTSVGNRVMVYTGRG